MKALSIKEPWASLVVDGYKTIEVRTWSTGFRGWLAVHASSKPVAGWLQWMLEEHHEKIPALGYAFGAVIGAVRVIDCRPLSDDDEPAAMCECAGLEGLIVDAAVRIEPVTARGALSLWELTGEGERRVRAAIAAWDLARAAAVT